jgi:hypothetical protein
MKKKRLLPPWSNAVVIVLLGGKQSPQSVMTLNEAVGNFSLGYTSTRRRVRLGSRNE